ncbi:MAG: KpsF/GutQ family sugar-phosphate isomerase, partial [Clostridia bacterium]
EADAVRGLVARVAARFAEAVRLIGARRGRVVGSGMGKSGHIARKIAATLSSTGTPAYFVHPAEASHGDLGMVDANDVFIAISYSGTNAELLEILPLLKRLGVKLVAITGNAASPLAREADVALDAAVEKEACPHNLAPTASTTAALALGDALALALLDARGFSAADFARYHPRGQLQHNALARQALLHVRDVMRSGDQVPRVAAAAAFRDAVAEMSRGTMGMTAVLDAGGALRGIFTDGDLRRAIERGGALDSLRVADVMTRSPKTVDPDMLAAHAVHLMEQHKVSALLVVDAHGALVGALNLHDLFRAKVI